MRQIASIQHGPDVAAEAQNRLVERLAVSEKRHREILDELPEVVILLDKEGRVNYVNSAWQRLMNMDSKKIHGHSFIDFVMKEDRLKWKELLEAGTMSEDVSMDRLVRFNQIDGDPICMNTKIRLLETGEFVCCLEDFTARRRLEAELLKSQKLESLGRLAGGLAHDFNNSLAIILGNLNIAQAKLVTGQDVEEELNIAARACMHASGVTKQMLTFSKGGGPVTTVASLTDLVQESVELKLRGSKTRVVYDIDDTIPPVEMDRGQMQQVLINILLNADQAMPEGGNLQIRMKCGHIPNEAFKSDVTNAVILEIRDEGIGIPKDDIEHVFDPYFTTKKDGTGLGLTSAFWIVQRHGGILELDSSPGVGTVIRLTLPFAKDAEVQDFLEKKGVLPKKSYRILIMDDNELVRSALEAMLQSLGHDVVATNDGEACVDAYSASMEKGEEFDLVILDLTVPGGQGGVWAFGHIRELNPKAKAIVASGYGTDSAISEPCAYGFKGRLQKPFEIDELQEAIDLAMLRRSRITQ